MNVSIVRDKGMLKICINDKLYAPLSFKSFRPNPKNVSEFYNAGVRLFSVLSSGIINALGVPYSLYGESWVGEDEYDFSVIDKQMDMFIANAPDAYFAPMFQIDTRPWYLESHKNVPNSFTHLSQIAHDAEWREAASKYLKAVINHCEEKYGDKIYGYFIMGGMTTEWFSFHDREASHPIKNAAYKKYLGEDNANLPSLEDLNRTGDVFLTTEEDNVRIARRFHAETVTDLVLYFAAAAQSILKHKKLLGCYYGYLMHLNGEFLFSSGHLGYEKLFLSDDIDMISSPSDYHYRKISDPSAFMVTQRTLDMHNKLYFLEFDHITHVAPKMVSDGSTDPNGNAHLVEIPGADSKCNDELESLNLMYRDFVLCFAKGAALWWFDMFDGWFRSEEMMNAVKHMITIHTKNSHLNKDSIAEIAVFAEGESLYNVRKSSGVGVKSLINMQRTLSEMGAPYDLYSIADIMDSAIDKYRFIILLDSYDISEEKMQRIRTLQANNTTVLWLYAPDYAHCGKNAVNSISKTVNMNVTVSEISHGNVIYGNQTITNDIAAPYFAINDSSSIAIAKFDDGATAIAKSADGKNIYAAIPFVNSGIVSEIISELGIFKYSNNPLVYTYVNHDTIGVYNAIDEDAVVYVKKDGEYVDLLTETSFVSHNGMIKLEKRDFNAYLLVKKEIAK